MPHGKPNKFFSDITYPRDYQWEGIYFLAKHNHAILNDDTGLGKTMQAVIAFSYYKHKFPDARAVVLTEKSIVYQIAEEFQRLTPDISVAIIIADNCPPSERSDMFLHHGCDVVVTSYSMVYKYMKFIVGGVGKDYVLLCDEPNAFRNTGTKLHRCMRTMSKYAARIHGLTAMVMENKLEDAYGVVKVIAPDIFPTKEWFYKKFCKYWSPPGRQFQKIVTGYKNLDVYRNIVSPYVLRRTYDDVDVELPDIIEQNIPVILNRKQSAKVLEAINTTLEMTDGSYRTLEILPSLTAQQQLVNDPRILDFDIPSTKLEVLYDLLDTQLFNERVIITSKFRDQIDLIEDDLRVKKWAAPILRITGAETAKEREEAKQIFQKENNAILLMTKAGSKGLNLQSGRVIIHMDLPWGYGTYRQYAGRVKRIGSTHKHVLIYRLLSELDPKVAKEVYSPFTIDHHILGALERKRVLFSKVSGDVEIDDDEENDIKQIISNMRGGTNGNS